MRSIAVASFFVGLVIASDDPFVGNWKFNPQESKLTGLREKIENLGDNKYRFTFGDDTDTIVTDGTDQPSKFGGTWSVKQQGPNTWRSVRKRDGKTTSTSTWTISDGGKLMTISTQGTQADGTSFNNEMKTKRVAGTSGIAGTWESTEVTIGSPDEWHIQPYDGTKGLSFITPASKEQLDLKFDGKDYAARGPRVAPNATTCGKRVDQRTLEITDKLKGKVTDTAEYKVSEGGRTLTLTMHYAGVKTPQTIIYDRQ